MAMNERGDLTDDDLDDLFAEARGLEPQPSGDLMARILADAAREMRGPVPMAPQAPVRGGWREWIAALGGWPAAGALAFSTVAGIWIGISAPAGLSQLAPELWGEGVSVALGVDDDPLSLLEG